MKNISDMYFLYVFPKCILYHYWCTIRNCGMVDTLLMCHSILSEGIHNMKYKMNEVLENNELGMVFYLVLCTLGCLITANSKTTFFSLDKG